jgi:Flp pilus assembly protein TadG
MLTPARKLPLRSERGQSIVEFVFVLPFMLVLLFGIVDFGMAMNNAADLNQVAANTARKLSVNSTAGLDPTAYAKSNAEKAVRDNPSLIVTVSVPNGTTPGPNAAVCVKLTMSRTIHIIPGFPGAGPSLSMSGKAAQKLEMPATFSGYSAGQAACS